MTRSNERTGPPVPSEPVHLQSASLASDGSFIALSEVGPILAERPHRVIGGVAIALHQQRLGLEHPIRATADADFGIPPYALHDDSLVAAVESLGYERTHGNRWVRVVDDARTASVDLLVPSYRTRLRSSVQHGSTNTTEVGGLAEALKRSAVRLIGDVTTTDGRSLPLDILLPDLASLLGLKLHARRVRSVDRDAVDLWTCMELVVSAGEAPEFASQDFDEIRDELARQFGPGGSSLNIVTRSAGEDEAERRRVRLRALVRAIIA